MSDTLLDRNGTPISTLDLAICLTCLGHGIVHSATGAPWVATDPDTWLTEEDEPIQCSACLGKGHTL